MPQGIYPRKPFTEEHKRKMSETHKRIGSGRWMKGRSGEKNNNWKGEKAGYQAKHKWLVKEYGNPSKCELCDEAGRKKNGNWSIHWANISGKYKRHREDYLGLCVRCHFYFDGKTLGKVARILAQKP